jgi:hypothetical protein
MDVSLIVNATDLGLEAQENILKLTAPITNVWWACTSKGRIRQTLPNGWLGTCAPVLLVQTVRISHQRPVIGGQSRHRRSFDQDGSTCLGGCYWHPQGSSR